MARALITGITGQDGTYLSALLLGKGTSVTGIARTSPSGKSKLNSNVQIHLGDVNDSAFVSRVVEATRPQEIYHLAGQSSVGASFSEPVATFESVAVGTLNVLQAAAQANPRPRVLVAASGEVFGDRGGEAACESSPLCPLSPYGAAKSAAVHLTRCYRASYGLFASVAFFYNHESPLRPQQFVTKKIVHEACRIARGIEQRLELGDVSVVRDWGWAPEYIEAAERMLTLDAPEDFVIATGESCSLELFVERVFSCLGLSASDHVTTSGALLRPAEIPAMRADPTRAASHLGWRAGVRGYELARRLVEAELRELDADAS